MGCLGIGVAALLALAVPASIARTSLLGAYVVLVLLALATAAAVVGNGRRRGRLPDAVSERPRRALLYVGALTVVYAVVVAIIHETG